MDIDKDLKVEGAKTVKEEMMAIGSKLGRWLVQGGRKF